MDLSRKDSMVFIKRYYAHIKFNLNRSIYIYKMRNYLKIRALFSFPISDFPKEPNWMSPIQYWQFVKREAYWVEAAKNAKKKCKETGWTHQENRISKMIKPHSPK